MKISKLSIGVVFLLSSASLLYAQQKVNDTVKKEKKIEGVVIQGTSKKSTESNIISLQKKSVEVIERVGSVQLEKQGVGDVATAVTKATGTQKEEGEGKIVVRGLGDRTISTTLNGLPIPSNDPANRNIDLEIFKTELADYISIEKVFYPRMNGNMAGANIDIASRFHYGKPYFKIKLGSSINTSVIDLNHFYLQDGTNYFGTKILQKPSNGNTAYRFTSSWNNKEILNPINSSLDLEFGKSFKTGKNGGLLSVFGYGGFDNDYYYVNDGISRTYPYQGIPTKDFTYKKYNYQTNTTGALNLNYKINNNHRIFAIANYTHNTEQSVKEFKGFYNDILNDASQGYVLAKRAEHRSTDLFISQLGGENQINQKLKLLWNLGFNRMNSVRPDQMQNISRFLYSTGTFSFSNNSTGDNNRYYDSLTQLDYVGALSLEYKVNEKLKATAGFQGSDRDTKFEAIQYNFKPNFSYNFYVDPSNYDAFFNQPNFEAGLFSIITFRGTSTNPNALVPQTFHATQKTYAGYVNLDYKFSERFFAQAGVRYENVDLKNTFDVAIQTFGDHKYQTYEKILPSVNLKYSLNDKQNLRLSGSKTYIQPTILEFSPFSYQDVDKNTFGNPYVYPADSYNADLKWELFPKSSEVFSIVAFSKFIKNPISRVNLLSAASTESFVNIGDNARVLGIEAEIRKDILKISNNKLYIFANFSYIDSKQDVSNEKVLNDTNSSLITNFRISESELQGASKILGNFNIGYNKTWVNSNFMDFVVSYNYVGENLYSVGTGYMGNVYNLPLNMLDVNFKYKFSNGIGIGASGKNLLNPKFTREQRNDDQTLTIEQYKKGTKVGLSFSYEF